MPRSKRIFDILVTAMAAPVWLPIMAITSLAILITDGWPILYISKRYVQKNSFKTIVKFRTMVKNAERIANRSTVLPDTGKMLNIVIDPALYTRTGTLLEKIHFTELPQLIQVLCGTLTLVGSRPMPENMLTIARTHYPYIDERFCIPGGITGPAQLVGRDKLTDIERLKLEVTYSYICQNAYSPLLDLHILFMTVMNPLGFYSNLSVEQVNNILFLYANKEQRSAIEARVMATLLR